MFVGAEFQIDPVGVVDEFDGEILTDERRQVAADLGGERQFPVRESARTGEAGGDMAIGFAVHALFRLALGAATFFNRLTLFDDQNGLFGALTEQFDGGEDAGRSGTDDNNIVSHKRPLSHFSRARARRDNQIPEVTLPAKYSLL